MNSLIVAGSAIVILAYFPLWWQIKKRAGAGQNIFSWVLWCALDMVVMAALLARKGSFILAAAYTVGTGITVIVVRKYGEKPKWTRFETLVLGLVFASMVVWYFSGSKVAVIAGTVAQLVAGMPQIAETWRKPKESPTTVYFIYFLANCLSVAGGRGWTVEERFFPSALAVFTVVIGVISLGLHRRTSKLSIAERVSV